MTPEEQLTAQLAEYLGQPLAAELVAALTEKAGERPLAVAMLALLAELREASAKVAQGAVEVLPELRRRGGLDVAVPWLDLGVAMAASSGAAGLRYFKESPLVLGLLEGADVRRRVLGLALELADSDPNVALDFFRHAPELLTVLPPDQVGAWAEVGLDLARLDYVLGIEFFRESPAIARVVPLELVRDWVGFGTKLITQNSLGKTDYLGTLEFFRTSPAILSGIESPSVRKAVVQLGSVMADRAPHDAIAFLAESPAQIGRLPTEAWRMKVLQYGGLVAERDAAAALEYLRRCPEVLALVGGSSVEDEKFEEWFRGGMDVLAYSAEGARAYFALKTQKALASLEQAMSGVALRQVARTLKLFVEGLCGTDVTIQSLPDPVEAGKEPARARVSQDGSTISLPSLLRRYPTREENVRLYTVMAAHEAGHLEFGTYRVPLGRLADLETEVRRRYGREPRDEQHPIRTLDDLFRLYPQAALVRDLWTVLEDARVEVLLRDQYPGLKRDLTELAREAVSTRSLAHGLSVRELVVDALLMLSTAEPQTVRIPDAIRDLVERVWTLCRTQLTPQATGEDIVRLVDRVYVTLDELVAKAGSWPQTEPSARPEPDVGTGPQASESLAGDYRPVTNWVYRGAMNPEQVSDHDGVEERSELNTSGPDMAETGQDGESRSGSKGSQSTESRSIGQPGEGLGPGTQPLSQVEEMLAVGADSRRRPGAGSPGEPVFLYDEWDGLLNDYRTRWCRVVERVAAEGQSGFAEATLRAHGPAVRMLRRYFESLRPPGLRRVPGQSEGEELDVDALIRRTADRAAGVEPSDRIYVRREKREREVAAAFLVDLSGSTSRQIGPDGRRVIDIEKEGLVLLCEALEAIGDQYAVYGYSGQGRHEVDFWVLKDFDEPARGRVAARIGAAAPQRQNRDGAAIRHATSKLLARSARIRLLMLISDGKPLDDAYADEYSLEDTKLALREARMRGIEPFCITVDRDAGDYLKRMYGEVRFLILDQAAALPERLPRVYQRLTT